MDFYRRVLGDLIEAGDLKKTDSILVVCGGTFDIDTLRDMGFSNVTISNLDERYDEQSKPFRWAREDAENLSFANLSFDWAFVHAGLHHCGSPHKALTEMYRVSRKGAVIIEARDSALMRFAAWLGFTVHYELEAVCTNEWVRGGLRNGAVPNFIYRWTEREAVKTIESAFPHKLNEVRFFYAMRHPFDRINMSSLPKRIVARILWAGVLVFQKLLPKQCNSFGFVVLDTGKLKPWMTPDGKAIRRDYPLKFDPARYGK
jgi:ubiquinone/menaquinone biosynthesis C-methylase UbiE